MTKLSRILTVVAAVAIVAIVGLSECGCTTTPHNPNVVHFGVGTTVGHTTKQQFISIATDLEWSITIDYVAPEGEGGWCSLSRTEGTGNANVMMSFGENTLEEERIATLHFAFHNEVQSVTFTQRSAHSTTEPADLNGWLELPTFEADGNHIYFSPHMLPSTNNRQRSFSVLYDADNYLPLWVAYPLCRGNMYGSGGRVDDWGIYDPNIPKDKQLNMKYSYNGSYDRGHMLPSASRVASNDDNRQTFYPTNMTPQLGSLNQKKWATIEGQVRDWAEGCDTLYVVTGAVMQTVGGGESVNYTYCKSDSEKSVAIPNYYYKALLQYRNNGGAKSYQAIALWVPHTPASGAATMDDAITIDRLEELTGYDFFPNLDPSVEASVESTIDNRFWGL